MGALVRDTRKDETERGQGGNGCESSAGPLDVEHRDAVPACTDEERYAQDVAGDLTAAKTVSLAGSLLRRVSWLLGQMRIYPGPSSSCDGQICRDQFRDNVSRVFVVGSGCRWWGLPFEVWDRVGRSR